MENFRNMFFVYSKNKNVTLSMTNLIQFSCDGFESAPIGGKINNIHTLSEPVGGLLICVNMSVLTG